MDNSKKGPDHYRFYDTIGPEGVTIECQRYLVIGETPKCWYVMKEYDARSAAVLGEGFIKRKRKLVLKERGGRRMCYPDKAEAMQSYRHRKLWQIKHAKISLARAEAAANHSALLVEQPDLIGDHAHICEGGEYIRELGWGDY